ncbi:VOC family protein [Enterococcus alishanensis]
MHKFKLLDGDGIGFVVLKVKNFSEMVAFYHNVLGLEVIQVEEDTASLGVNQRTLLMLQKVSNGVANPAATGLYHLAFLLPTRKDLANILQYLLVNDIPLTGGADHGYSEALYLNDPEGNGVEIYWDKPISEWDIRENGEVVGVTEPMDAEGLIQLSDENWQGFPVASKIGHVHLKVADLVKTQEFYEDMLGFSLKYNFGEQAKFLSSGTYHHHIGANTWSGKDLPAMKDIDLGLAYFSIELQTEEFELLKQHLAKNNQKFDNSASDQIWITDPNGINILISHL